MLRKHLRLPRFQFNILLNTKTLEIYLDFFGVDP